MTFNIFADIRLPNGRPFRSILVCHSEGHFDITQVQNVAHRCIANASRTPAISPKELINDIMRSIRAECGCNVVVVEAQWGFMLNYNVAEMPNHPQP